MHRIFISYRRNEAGFAAGALGRDLRQHFGEAQVFRDREDIEGGVSWRAQVLSAIDHDSALLVLIDKQWLLPPPGRDGPRLFEPDDPVRLEILDALHDGATVIPLLLDEAEMPAAAALPPELAAMSEINALPLRDADWSYDFARVCTTLEHAGFVPLRTHRHGFNALRPPRPDTMRPVTVERPTAPPKWRRRRGWMIACAAAVLGLAGWWWWMARPAVEPPIPQRTVIFAMPTGGAAGQPALELVLPARVAAGTGGSVAPAPAVQPPVRSARPASPRAGRPAQGNPAPAPPPAAAEPEPEPLPAPPHKNPLDMRVQ